MVDITHLYGETFMGYLIELKTPLGNRYYFQNYDPGNIVTIGTKDYQWLPFLVASFNEQLELNSESLEIQVVNTPIMNTFFRDEGDIRRSVLVLKTIFPDAPNAPEDIERTQINSYTFSKAMIQIACSSPVTAINNYFPTRVFDPGTFPALPYFNSPGIQESGRQ